MYFNKYPQPFNFKFIDGFSSNNENKGLILTKENLGKVKFLCLENDIFKISFKPHKATEINYSTAELTYKVKKEAKKNKTKESNSFKNKDYEFEINNKTGYFSIKKDDEVIIESSQAPFGVCGNKSIIVLRKSDDQVVYGLGEKTGSINKTGKSYKSWNIDVHADQPNDSKSTSFDPSYANIPFFITKLNNDFYGVLIDNPMPCFFHFGNSTEHSKEMSFGAYDGPLEAYFIPGESLKDVVRKFAKLTGTHEMPPIWALGYHQSRWGYKSAHELTILSEKLNNARFPTSAIWMDIDYMDDYKVFSFNKESFSDEDFKKLKETTNKNGNKLVTIIDPGVKEEEGYEIYEEGVIENIFCKTPEKENYLGLVWPGKCLFPDFSESKTRDFWAKQISKHLEKGIDGIWLDMNDPSTGSSEPYDMLFKNGEAPHEAFHNQYAHLMAKATWEGFELNNNNKRPFILSRSAYTGSQKYTALWTGDNWSIESHLQMSIPMSINLALSGISFNGPDVGGFFGNCNEELMVTWMKAGALFPFFRNHAEQNSVKQEPFVYSEKAQDTIRRCINTRLKLLPYIYTQFFLHNEDGDPVMRPISYEFKGKEYEEINEQFMIGDKLMIAPFTDTKDDSRKVVLPNCWWFSMRSGKWLEGGREIEIQRENTMDIFIRDGSIIPCLEGTEFSSQPNMFGIGFHIFLKDQAAQGFYYEDDCETRNYQSGEFNLYEINISEKGEINIVSIHDGYETLKRKIKLYNYSPTIVNSHVDWPFGKYPINYIETDFGK